MTKFETLAYGYGLIEGPRVDEHERIYFSDVQNGGVYRRSPDGKIETLIPKRRGVGGLALNQGGGLIMGGKSICYWDERTNQSRDLLNEWDGRRIVGFNDIQPDAHGSIFAGTVEFNPFEKARIPGRLFRIDSDGKAHMLFEGIGLSNGMGFSPDGKLLYHNDSDTKDVWVYDVTADRSVKDRRVFGKLPDGMPDGIGDGLAVDAEGGVLVAVAYAGDVVRYKPNGTVDWRLKVPAYLTTSLTFGGKDLQDLYIVTADNKEDASRKGTVFRTRVEIPGLPIPRTRFQ